MSFNGHGVSSVKYFITVTFKSWIKRPLGTINHKIVNARCHANVFDAMPLAGLGIVDIALQCDRQ